MTNIVGVILARSGSSRVPDKNMKWLASKPLIYYTIREALKAKTLSRVIVGTNSRWYARVAKFYGAEVPYLQPEKVSGDVGPTPALLYCVEYLEDRENYPVDIVVLLEPTSPFRLAQDIDNAVNKFVRTEADSIISVCEVSQPPEWMFKLNGDKMVSLLGVDVSRFGRLPRKATSKCYIPNGCVFVVKRDVLMREHRIYGKDCRALIMPRERSVDIDTLEDFNYAEYKMLEKGKTL